MRCRQREAGARRRCASCTSCRRARAPRYPASARLVSAPQLGAPQQIPPSASAAGPAPGRLSAGVGAPAPRRPRRAAQGFGGYLADLPAGAPAARRRLAQAPAAAATEKSSQFDVAGFARPPDVTARCTRAAGCFPGLAQEASAVVAIVAVDLRLGSVGRCTGAVRAPPPGVGPPTQAPASRARRAPPAGLCKARRAPGGASMRCCKGCRERVARCRGARRRHVRDHIGSAGRGALRDHRQPLVRPAPAPHSKHA